MNAEAAPRQHRGRRGGGAAVVPVVGGTRPADVLHLLAELRARLDAGTPRTVLLPQPPGERPAADVPTGPVPPGTLVLLRTSGSTSGSGRLVALGADALVASARATEQHLAGPGRWVLPLPAHHVAGVQVLVRSAVAGTEPAVLDTSGGFDPMALAELVEGLEGVGSLGTTDAHPPLYTSLVPTQLVRVLEAGPAAVEPLRRFAAILVGGAATDTRILERAREAGLAVRTTYGMTETGGGCVYDGAPLPGVRIDLEPGTERIMIAGPMLATAYVDDPEADAEAFVTVQGVRWLRTADRGALTDAPSGQRLRVLGRVDEVVNTGGVKVSPTSVEAVLSELVDELVVVGVPDPGWGELVTAVVVARRAAPPRLADLRAAARRRLDGAHAPRALVVVDELPVRGPGKVDRRASAALAAERLASPDGVGVERH